MSKRPIEVKKTWEASRREYVGIAPFYKKPKWFICTSCKFYYKNDKERCDACFDGSRYERLNLIERLYRKLRSYL